MVNTCCAPKCKSELQRRADWISKVPRICWKPREDANIYTCELHFQEKDFIQNSADTNNRRKRKKAADDTLIGAVLNGKSIWQGAPSYLSNISSPGNSNLSSSEARRKMLKQWRKWQGLKKQREINSIN